MGKPINFKIIIAFILFIFCTHKNSYAQLYPDFESAQKHKKKQQVVLPRFPPQYKKDTVVKAIAGVNPNYGKIILKPKARTDSFVRIISKREDANGNTITEQELVVGNKKTKQTIINGGLILNKKFNADTLDKDSISIQIVKKNFRMYVYYKHRFLTAYKCVFGPNYLEQKQKEGDRRTPEGWFKILDIHPHKEWTLFMLLDYPNEESYKSFLDNKKNGTVASNERIGGSVGIHGVWEGADMVVDQKRNWTDGCIALKTADLIQLSKIVKVGTPVFVRLNK